MGNRDTPTEASEASVTDMQTARNRQEWRTLKMQRLEEELGHLQEILVATEQRTRDEEQLAFEQFDRAERAETQVKLQQTEIDKLQLAVSELKEDIEAFKHEMRAYEEQLTGEQNRTDEQYDRAIAAEELAKKHAQEAAEARGAMRDLLEMLEREREHMSHAARGYEKLERHFRQIATEHGVPPEAFALTEALMAELAGMDSESAEPVSDSSDLQAVLTNAEVDELVRGLTNVSKPPPSLPPSIKPVTIPPRPRPKSVAPRVLSHPEDDAPVVEVSEGDRGTLGYDEADPFTLSEAPTALSEQNGTPEAEVPQRITQGFGDLRPSSASADPISLTTQAIPPLQPAAVDDSEWDDSDGNTHSRTIAFDPRFDPNGQPESRNAMLPQPPSQPPPTLQRPPGWKPPPPTHPGVRVPSADPSKRRK
jgi:hypothetical protein